MRRVLGYLALAITIGLAFALGSVLLHSENAPDISTANLVARWQPEPENVIDRQFPTCGSGRRTNCVVDGDTFWVGGEKVRIADINTPEIGQPLCDRERVLGQRAARRLRELMNAGPFELRRSGSRDTDQYGRLLRTVYRDGKSLGDTLVAEGLAHHWRGYKEDWCAGT